MSAMPERVWLITARPDEWPIPVRYWSELEPNNLRVGRGTPYVPESRLLAAEARVREVEAEMNVMRQEVQFAHELAEDKAIATRADLDALVPLARVGLFLRDKLLAGVTNTDLREHLVWCLEEWVVAIDGEDTPRTTQARAILAREAGE